ncbi:MAG: hypothetical protein GF384_05170 [Elusimicrobia bacterium]|nr:hypothetical protein [Elusimicrobiota bacterium]MBD3412182.1 hypothetical protein [Elusimicrobiota bacterium]
MMKGIVCKVCGYVAINGHAPEKCPVCWAPKTAFEEKPEALHTDQDKAEKGETEKKHIPFIVVQKKCGLIPEGCTDVHVKIGEIIHPMQAQHYITKIDFYLNNEYLSRVYLTPDNLQPAAGLHLKAQSGTISVIEHCNIHGSWIKQKDL